MFSQLLSRSTATATATAGVRSRSSNKRIFLSSYSATTTLLLSALYSTSHSRMSKAMYEPPSLSGKPFKSLVPPGQCQFTDDWTSVPLLERINVSKSSNSYVLRFGPLPDKSLPLNLSTCACILAKTDKKNNDDDDGKVTSVIRPYTPVSTNNLNGYFDLLIKDYGPSNAESGGGLSNHLCSTMNVGDTIDFKHIKFNIKIQYPEFSSKKIIMLVGGTGITPMIQALHAILGDNENNDNEVVMLYGSRTEDDILGRTLVDSWAKQYPKKFKSIVHVLSDEKEKSDTESEVKNNNIRYGYINQKLIEESASLINASPTTTCTDADSNNEANDDDVIIFVCGPPPMYNALCGSRDTPELSGVLKEMGYSSKQVYKF
jgi:cytochrome-b5 reductase